MRKESIGSTKEALGKPLLRFWGAAGQPLGEVFHDLRIPEQAAHDSRNDAAHPFPR